jgi:hypothetical protein
LLSCATIKAPPAPWAALGALANGAGGPGGAPDAEHRISGREAPEDDWAAIT